jgi:chromosome segregation ATPase
MTSAVSTVRRNVDARLAGIDKDLTALTSRIAALTAEREQIQRDRTRAIDGAASKGAVARTHTFDVRLSDIARLVADTEDEISKLQHARHGFLTATEQQVQRAEAEDVTRAEAYGLVLQQLDLIVRYQALQTQIETIGTRLQVQRLHPALYVLRPTISIWMKGAEEALAVRGAKLLSQ